MVPQKKQNIPFRCDREGIADMHPADRTDVGSNMPLTDGTVEGSKMPLTDKIADNDTICGRKVHPILALWFDRIKITVSEIGSYVFDVGSDLLSAAEHFRNGDNWWALATIATIMFPTVPIFIDYKNRKINDFKEKGKLKIISKCSLKSTSAVLVYLNLIQMGYIFGGIIFVTIYQIFNTFWNLLKMWKTPPGKDRRILLDEEPSRDTSREHCLRAKHGKFLECMLEAAPQSILAVSTILT